MALVPSPLQRIDTDLFSEKGLTVHVKRDDLIHPTVMGNKWRKLKYNLAYALEQGFEGVITPGGAYSNHVAATAAACREHQLASVGIIRGDELHPSSNATLKFASACGMKLHFVDRGHYRVAKQNPEEWRHRYPKFYFLPEGGTNHLAIKGCQEIVEELEEGWDYLAVSIGTGGTMAGLLKGMKGQGLLVGFSSLKGVFMEEEFGQLASNYGIPYTNYKIISDFHFGGYGKTDDTLIDFINREKAAIGLLFDPLYTAKMYFGLLKLVRDNFFEPGSKIVVLHTGGLQAIEGYNEKYSKKIIV